jgi:hypothetical protein
MKKVRLKADTAGWWVMRPIVLLLAVLTLLTLLTLSACDDRGPSGPTVPLNQQFVLAPGEAAAIEDSSLRVRFDGVTGDSRCPADALCVLGGDAVVRITVQSGGGSRGYDLHTGDMRPVSHNDATIALVQLAPYPFSATPIQPNDYRATFLVTR